MTDEGSRHAAPAPVAPARTRAAAIPYYVAALAVAASGSAVAVGYLAAPHRHVAWVALAPYAGLLVLGEYLLVRFGYHGDVNALNLFEAVLAPVLFNFPGAVVVGVVALAQAVAAILRRNAPVKAAFNVAQWALAAGVGTMVLAVTRDGSGVSWHNTAALLLSLVAVSVVNQSAFSGVMWLASGESLADVLRGLAPVMVPGWLIGGAVNAALGVVLVAAYATRHEVVLLYFVPLGLLHWANRSYAEVRADHARLSGLHRATLALATPVNPRDAITQFLVEVRNCFEAEVAEVVLVRADGREVLRVAGDEPAAEAERAGEPAGLESRVESGLESPALESRLEARREPLGTRTLAAVLLERGRAVRVGADCEDPTLAEHLRREGWRDCVAAPIAAGDQVLGVLCTYNRTGLEGFEQGELTVLEALARELAGAISKSSLLETVLEERRKLADIVSHASDGIATLDADGTIVSWNPAMETITGYGAEVMVGTQRLGVLRPRDEDGRDVLLERWASREGLPHTLQVLTPNGERRWLSCSYTRVPALDSSAICIVMARDVTEAHDLKRLKDDFVATVSHELRTPLSPILGWAETLLTRSEGLDEAQRRKGMEAILRQGKRLERLIVNLLEVSRLEGGTPGDVQEEIEPVRVAARVVEDLRIAWPDRDIRLEEPPHCGRATGNEIWLEQILTNLVSNALKYAPGPEPVVVSIVPAAGAVEMRVSDAGPGIPAAVQERIFQRFERFPHAGAQPGTGLGLYIARQLAHAIGATLEVASEVGQGSTFTLRLQAPVRLMAVN